MSDNEHEQDQVRIPAVALLLLRLRFRGELGEALIGDLQEELAERVSSSLATRRWLWGQTIRSILTLPSFVDSGCRSQPKRGGRCGTIWPQMVQLAVATRRSARSLRRRPLLTVVTVLTLAIGIGAGTIVLAVAHGVLMRPLPFAAPDQLVGVNRLTPEVTGPSPPLSMLAGVYMVPFSLFLDWQEGSDGFVALGGYAPRRVTLTGDGVAESLLGLRTTSGVFAALKKRPLLGREMLPSDDHAGAAPVAVLSYGLWQERYGADPSIIDRAIHLSGSSYTVVGVMPRGFAFPSQGFRLWYSFSDEEKASAYRAGGYLKVIGRLHPDVSPALAQERMDTLARSLGERFPEEADHGVRITPYERLVVGDAGQGLLVFFGAVAMVLLITCSNTAGLMLIRLFDRTSELAVRAALGAGRWHLFVESMSEGLALSVTGGLLGVAVAAAGLRPFVAAFPGGLPRSHEIGVDGGFVLIALGLSLLVGLATGGLPALRLARIPIEGAVRGGREVPGGDRSQIRVQSALVVAQVSLAFALMAGAGLFVTSYQRLLATEKGFETADLWVMDVVLPDPYRSNPASCYRFFTELKDRLEAITGVSGVAMVEQIPFLSGLSFPPVFVETAEALEQAAIHSSRVSPSYFEVMGIRPVAGRVFDMTDRYGSLPVTVVNRAMAGQYWPGEDPLGRRINIGSEEDPAWLTVIGVVEDVRYRAFQEPFPEFYQSIEQAPQWYLSVLISSRLDTGGLARPVVAAINELDPDISATVRSFAKEISRSPGFSGLRFGASAISSLAVIAALLAVLGIYGLLAFMVLRRTQEIGIRMVLGAQRGAILRSVLGRGATLVGIGLVVGVTVALLGGRLVEASLFGICATDPVNLVQAGILVALAGVAACLIPARRATAVDPVRSLRQE
jgi:predicted permease